MPFAFIIPAALGLIGASQQSSAAQSAANTSAAAGDRAAAIQKEIADQQVALQREQFNRQIELQQPWRQAGTNALAQMQGGAFAQPEAFRFGAGDYQDDPGYAFRLAEGQKLLDRTAAREGRIFSGSALKAATRYGQEMGSQEYSNAYNRALTGYNANVARSDTGYNRLASLAGVGQTATGQLGAAGQNMASGISNALGSYGTSAGNIAMGQGADQGNALLAGAQARTSAYQGIGSLYGRTQPNFNSLFGGGGGGGSMDWYNNAPSIPMQPGGGY